MDYLQTLFGGLSVGIFTYRYLLIFVLALVEGPIIMVASGILLKLGHFNFLPLYLTLILGDFVADIGWYGVGYYGGRAFITRWGKYFSITPEILDKLEVFFKKNQTKILLISKMTMGFGFALATLITAGLIKVDFKKYAWFNFLGGFVWTGLLLSIGYSFGQIYSRIDKGFKVAFLVFLSVVVLFALYGLGKFFKQNLLNKVK